MEKMDRRVRKTRALLLQGLVKMMENHDIQDISVKELTELVDINRGTFYLHYDDIYDMLHKVEDENVPGVQRDHGAGTARYSHIVL